MRDEEIQVVSVKNEEKLHDKVRKFAIDDGKIVGYGTCIRVYEQFIDESLEHEKFKMENTYTWRINKLAKGIKSIEAMEKPKPISITNNYQPEQKAISSIQTTFRKNRTSGELVIKSDNLIAVLTEIQEVIFLSVETLAVKFTIILDIPHD